MKVPPLKPTIVAAVLKGATCEAYVTLADGRKYGLGVSLTGERQTDAQLLRALAVSLQQGVLSEAHDLP